MCERAARAMIAGVGRSAPVAGSTQRAGGTHAPAPPAGRTGRGGRPHAGARSAMTASAARTVGTRGRMTARPAGCQSLYCGLRESGRPGPSQGGAAVVGRGLPLAPRHDAVGREAVARVRHRPNRQEDAEEELVLLRDVEARRRAAHLVGLVDPEDDVIDDSCRCAWVVLKGGTSSRITRT